MSIAAEQIETQVSEKVDSIIAQQRRLLKRFDDVSHYLGGAAAGMYLPGIDQSFDNPVRHIGGNRRPPLLTLEVKDDSLTFSGAISRLRNDKLIYSVIFSYDISLVYTPRGGGKTLPANNIVLARRANELLAALTAYGRRASFGMHEELQPLRLPTVVRDGGRIVAEDYTSILGFEADNPAKNINTVDIRRPNPADKILARRGIEYPLGASQPELEDMVVEFRSESPDFEIEWSTAVEALLFKRPYFNVALPLEEATVYAPEAAVLAMRSELPKKYQWEASFNDLLLAAKNPQNPLRISRLSAVQLFPMETAQDLPDDYAGTVLTPNNWAPSSIRPAVMQDNA
jgi:hypothetical protein